MRTKLYFGALALMWLLSGCADSPNAGNGRNVGNYGGNMYSSFTLNNHEYIVSTYRMAHSGECKQCKHELDSIVRKAIREEIGK